MRDVRSKPVVVGRSTRRRPQGDARNVEGDEGRWRCRGGRRQSVVVGRKAWTAMRMQALCRERRSTLPTSSRVRTSTDMNKSRRFRSSCTLRIPPSRSSAPAGKRTSPVCAICNSSHCFHHQGVGLGIRLSLTTVNAFRLLDVFDCTSSMFRSSTCPGLSLFFCTLSMCASCTLQYVSDFNCVNVR